MSFFIGCLNPFSPALDEYNNTEKELISDQKNIDGIFKNFLYSYTFKDTTIYGGLLADNFLFMYRDYEKGYDVSWSRNEDVRITNLLFNSAEKVDLIWNNMIASSIDTLESTLIRSFNLTITFNPTDIIQLDGRVNLTLERKNATEKWMITRWRDESNY